MCKVLFKSSHCLWNKQIKKIVPISCHQCLANLLPAICQGRRWHRRQICCQYRWLRCQQHKRNWWQNLPPVSLIPVVHLNLWISPWIFERIRNGLNEILWGWGKLIHKKTRSKYLVTLSLKLKTEGGGRVCVFMPPEMEFMNAILTKDLSLFHYAIHSSFY